MVISAIDMQVIIWASQHRSTCMDAFFAAITWFGLFGVAMALIGCVAFSRVYLQVHFASDVIAGILLPIVWAYGVAFLLHRI